MDALNFPRHIAPVAQNDRVKRARPRKDSGQGFNFAKHLKKQTQPSPPAEEAAEDPGREPPETPPDAREPGISPEGEACADARTPEQSRRLIDIRV